SLSVLDLVPGAHPIRLTVFSKGAIEELSKIKSPHLDLMVTVR
ncbi:MAG: 50S ribosomal protein L4, partial [Thaumarchaeota archaeon]